MAKKYDGTEHDKVTESERQISEDANASNERPDVSSPQKTISPSDDAIAEPTPKARERHSFAARLIRWSKAHKRFAICLAVMVLFVLLMAVPVTRYAVAGIILKQRFSVEVLDEQTRKPVASATVMLNGKKAVTDAKGRASIDAKVGSADLEVSKQHYRTSKQRVTVPIFEQKDIVSVRVRATGRQVSIKVTNKITGKAIENVTVKTDDSETKTGKDGMGGLVVPASAAKISAILQRDGYNEATVDVAVLADGMVNEFTLTPSGIIYFLSNKSGTLDIVKSNLDGTDRQTVLKGTGKEEKRATVFLASRDWKYLALLSKRDGGEYPKLFLLETGTDKLTIIDEGKATFNLVGWSDDRLIYRVDRVGLKDFDDKRAALKSYHAPAKKITTLDQTYGNGAPDYATGIYENFANAIFALPGGEVVFGKNAYANTPSDKQSGLYSIRPDGSSRKTIKTFPNRNYVEVRPYGPNGIYLSVDNQNNKNDYYEYEDGTFKATTEVDGNNFYDAYPTYLWSPSKKQTFWTELRDGKNTIFVGDIHGKNGKQVAVSNDYGIFGWFGDEYLLLTKNGSELYILSAEGGVPLKVTDYYKPEITFRGYGGGYGGL